MDNLTKIIENNIKRYRLMSKGDRIIVGVSGGADSVCLLYILSQLKEKIGFHIHVAHFNHLLRKESTRDEEFVKKLSEKLGLAFTSGKAKKTPKIGLFSEENARNARFAFLFNVAQKIGAKRIALAHNFNDQAETVLMRILRGTGLAGLSGIAFKKKMGKFEIIRPLLETKRTEIRNFLRSKRICFCTDKSNKNEAYLRNRIRHRLLPLLKKDYNKNIEEVLYNLARNAENDYDFLKCSASRYFKKNKTKLDIAKLKKLHPSMRRIKFRDAISSIQGSTRRINFKHIEEIDDLLLNRPQNSIVSLPKGITAVKKKKHLTFS